MGSKVDQKPLASEDGVQRDSLGLFLYYILLAVKYFF